MFMHNIFSFLGVPQRATLEESTSRVTDMSGKNQDLQQHTMLEKIKSSSEHKIPPKETGMRLKKQLNVMEKSIKQQRLNNVIILLKDTKICPFKWVRNRYFCIYCDRQFSDMAALREHNNVDHTIRTSTDIKEFFKRKKKHELLKVDITDITCVHCNNVYGNVEDIKRHLVEMHKKNIDLKIRDVTLPFKVTKDNYNCVICNEKYEDFKTLNHHMNVHFQNFICELCGAGFATPARLRSHAFTHETGQFPCESCDKIYRSANAKNEHFAVVHKKAKRHRCPHCNDTFSNYFQRNKHVSSIHGVKLKEFKCTMCPKTFTLTGKLNVHIQSVHLKVKRYSCDFCEWKFYSKSELKDHIVRHGGEKKFECSVCKKSYARKFTLKEHLRIHENDRRFVCSVCGRSFVQNCSLKHHLKVHHSNLVLK